MTPPPAHSDPRGEAVPDSGLYRRLAEQLPAITYIVQLHPQARTLFISPQVQPLLGYAPAEWQADPGLWFERIPPGHRERVAGEIQRHNETGEPFQLEYPFETKAGPTVWVRNSGRYARDAAGRPAVMHGMMLDITERKQAEEELRASEERFRTLFEENTAVKLIIDPDTGRILSANKAAAAFYGWSVAALQALRIQDINVLPPDNVQAEMQRVRNTGSMVFQFPHRRADGSIREVEVFSSRIEIQGRTVLYSIIQDITERRCAERELAQSHELLSLFIRHSPVYAFIKEVTPGVSRVLHASENFRQMIGIPGSEMAGKRMEELFPADLAAKITADDWEVVSNGQVLTLAEEFNGRSFTTIKFPIAQGGQTLLAGYTLDITERKRAEDRLSESERRLSEAQQLARLGSYVLDVARGTWESSKTLDQLFGIDRSHPRTVAGWEALLHPEDRAMMAKYFRDEVLGRGQPFDKEYRIIRQHDRALRWVHGLGRLECDAHGVPVRMIGTIQDITDRKLVAEEKAALEADLHQAQKMESVGRLAGGVAHDFNNILQAILGNVELALEQVPPDSLIRHDLEEVQGAGRRAADLIRQLLAFARKQTVAPRRIDLNQTVDQMLKMLRRLIGDEIKLVWSPGADLWPVRMDPTQTDQILANLCVNARDAMGGPGEIQIETRNAHVDELNAARHEGFVPGDYVQLMVSDTGCGMGKETQDRIFEPFFTTKDMGKGTGLGLSTVYGIVRQNQGHIAVYSEPGQGTTFRIYLPRLRLDTEVPVAPAAAKPVRRAGETLLLVEDDPAILKLTARIIEQQGYAVLATHQPAEAIRLAREHPGSIHLLLTDIVMPGMNGRELSERLLALRPDLKCLFMSGYTANVIARQGMLEPGVHFIQKPFSMADLDAKIRGILDR